MATTTEYLGLVKPDLTDVRDISVINGNMDTLDTTIHNLQNKGSVNAGKFLIVNSDGDVVPTTVPFANGVSF
jgi:hypothetical protein